MQKIYLTRHGETIWNKSGIMQGQKDSPLTEEGRMQAINLGKRLESEPIDLIVTSPLGRTMETSELIKGYRDIPIMTCDLLKEMHFGIWEGKPKDEIKKKYGEQYNNFWNTPHLYKPNGGEDFNQIFERATAAVEYIIEEYKEQNILIVTHAVVLKSLMAYFEKRSMNDIWGGAFMHPTCLSIIEIKDDKKDLILQGDISHYQCG